MPKIWSLKIVLALMERYERRAVIPVDQIIADFFPQMKRSRFLWKTMVGKIPLPVIRIDDSQKTSRGVHVFDLASYLEGTKAANDPVNSNSNREKQIL